MISVSALVSGDQLGDLLADDSEEAALMLVALARGCDVAELTDQLEHELLGKNDRMRDKLASLANVVVEALARTKR